MHILRLIGGILVFLAVLGFVLLNWHSAPLNLYGASWQLPVALIVLIALMVGIFIGVILGSVHQWRRKKTSL